MAQIHPRISTSISTALRVSAIPHQDARIHLLHGLPRSSQTLPLHSLHCSRGTFRWKPNCTTTTTALPSHTLSHLSFFCSCRRKAKSLVTNPQTVWPCHLSASPQETLAVLLMLHMQKLSHQEIVGFCTRQVQLVAEWLENPIVTTYCPVLSTNKAISISQITWK